jgi:hypothetical protein
MSRISIWSDWRPEPGRAMPVDVDR